jgi:hypothetical protein
MAIAIGMIFAVAVAGAPTFWGIVDDAMEIGWELVDPTTLSFTMIVRELASVA